MRISILTIILLFSTQHALAGNTNALPDLSLTVDRVNTDLDKDGIEDSAYLIHSDNEGYLDLWVSLSSSESFYKTPDVTYNMNGPLFGQGSELILNPQGSLVVHSYNEAISRSRWDRKVTFAHRKNQLVLAGYTWQERDTLDASYMTCDMNLLNRNATVEGALSRGFNSEGDFNLYEYNGSFEVAKADILTAGEATEENIYNLYVEQYCYSIPGEIAGDLGEAQDF